MKKSRTVIYAALSGLFYLGLSYLAENFKFFEQPFIILMFFLPGITFPLSTSYFDLKTDKLTIYLHLLLSFIIYYAAVWVFSLEPRYKGIVLIDGFFSSLLYMTASKKLLNLPLNWVLIFISAICSGLAFAPVLLMDEGRIAIGLSVFLWTLFNALIIGLGRKMSANNNFTVSGL